MTDHAGEQAMELEALEAILMDDLQVYDETNPIGWDAVGETYLVVIDPAEEGEEVADDVEKLMELLFAHTPNYPDEAPCVRLRALRGLSDGEIAAGMAHLQTHIEENMGMSMIFTLVSASKEWLRSRVDMAQQETPEQERKRLENEEEFRRSELRRHGTMFTPELFAAWKAKFDKEGGGRGTMLTPELFAVWKAKFDKENALTTTDAHTPSELYNPGTGFADCGGPSTHKSPAFVTRKGKGSMIEAIKIREASAGIGQRITRSITRSMSFEQLPPSGPGLADAKALEIAAQVAKDPDRITRLSGKQFFQSNLQSDVPEQALSDDEEDYVEGEGGEGEEDEDEDEDEECDFDEDTDDEDGVLDMVVGTLPATAAGR
ncbi:hypothetical protein FOA52_010477 [Chlamydomonas sp. UWO 241]|nr:hypothetical protein FOA52_010477 [Chlamydomonas sp. UWO 241]